MKNQTKTFTAFTSLALISSVLLSFQAFAHNSKDVNRFSLIRPAVLGGTCVPGATGRVKVTSIGNVEVMDVKIEGLPKNTEFDVFVIQVPNFPFGMSWYQGDIQTNKHGKGYARFAGRFNEETFLVAPGTPVAAPLTHPTDAAENPVTQPIHTYHIGIWFNSPADAVKAGCPDFVTPFNGEHNAGIQVLNTSLYPDLEGPLLNLKP